MTIKTEAAPSLYTKVDGVNFCVQSVEGHCPEKLTGQAGARLLIIRSLRFAAGTKNLVLQAIRDYTGRVFDGNDYIWHRTLTNDD